MFNDIAPGPFPLGSFNRGFIPNPFFTVANQFMPRNFKEVLRWADYITTQSPTAAEVIRKHATYPITDFTFETSNPKLEEKYKSLVKSLRLKHTLNTIGFDFYTRGNVFLSMYMPFTRMAKCPSCSTSYNVARSGNIKFKNFTFIGSCVKEGCSHSGNFEIHDVFSKSESEMNIVVWDPNHITVNHNPVTGRSEHYYEVPPSVRKKVMLGDPLFTSSLPLAMIECIKEKKHFKFDEGKIFHMSNMSIGRLEDGLCIPPIMSIYSLVFHQAVSYPESTIFYDATYSEPYSPISMNQSWLGSYRKYQKLRVKGYISASDFTELLSNPYRRIQVNDCACSDCGRC